MTELYQRQLNHLFNRPTTEPAWYWSDHWEEGIFEDEPLSAFVFIETLLRGAKTDLSPFSNDQIGLGLTYIFDSACSNLASDFKAADVPFERKVAALRSLSALFRDVFNPLCEAKTAAFSQDKLSPLNYICYMFWDVTPLSSFLHYENQDALLLFALQQMPNELAAHMPKEVQGLLQMHLAQSDVKAPTVEDILTQKKEMYANMDADTHSCYMAIASVMEDCLQLDNPACVESGLHGLGHLVTFLPDIAVPIIDGYLKNRKKKPKALVEYAKMAKTGMIL